MTSRSSVNQRWAVVLEWSGPEGLFAGAHREEKLVAAKTAEEAVEFAFSRSSVLAHVQGVTARAYKVSARSSGEWRSQYENPERKGSMERLPDYGDRVTVQL